MSVAAVMMVRDDADVVGATIDHLLTQVDHVYVADNRSVDGTTDIVRAYGEDTVSVTRDEVVAYEQSEKTTRLAFWAAEEGHEWVVPCDADEVWSAPGRTVRDLLNRVAYDVQIVTADLYDHIPTNQDDPAVIPPQVRIGWRRTHPGVLPKVAVRVHRGLTIHPGNHGADYGRSAVLAVPGLTIDHFTWRTAEQYLRKIRNGIEAYRTVARQDIGVHWRMHDGATDEQIREHFLTWFYVTDPAARTDLRYDPLTLGHGGRLERHGEVPNANPA